MNNRSPESKISQSNSNHLRNFIDLDQLLRFHVIGNGDCSALPSTSRTSRLSVASSKFNLNAETLIYSNYEETLSFLLEFSFTPPLGSSRNSIFKFDQI
jgi:hypothetical protein